MNECVNCLLDVILGFSQLPVSCEFANFGVCGATWKQRCRKEIVVWKGMSLFRTWVWYNLAKYWVFEVEVELYAITKFR